MSAVPISERVDDRYKRHTVPLLPLAPMTTKPVNPNRYKRNPLRCVVSREIVRHRINWGSTALLYHEILSCLHPYTCIPVLEADYVARRRRCAACGEAQVRCAAPTVLRSRSPQATADAPRRAAIHTPPHRRAA